MRATRGILIAVGVLGLVLGAVVLLLKQDPMQIVGVGLWVLAAIVLHDGILSPLVVLVALLVRRAGRRIPFAVLVIVQVGVGLGAILSLLVVPEIYAKTLGVANPTVLPFDYGLRLALSWLVIAALTALACVVYLARTRRSRAGAALPARPASPTSGS